MPRKSKKKQFEVSAEYGCRVETTVEAEDEKEAEEKAMGELDDLASRNYSQRSLIVRELE